MAILVKERVTIHCLNDVMLLSMYLQDIPQIKTSSLHLRHMLSQPHHVTGRTAVFRVPFQGCGTTRGTTHGRLENYITFSNVVENSLPLNNSRMIVSHTPKLYPFSCHYRQKYAITLKEGTENRTGDHKGVKQRHEGKNHSDSSQSCPQGYRDIQNGGRRRRPSREYFVMSHTPDFRLRYTFSDEI